MRTLLAVLLCATPGGSALLPPALAVGTSHYAVVKVVTDYGAFCAIADHGRDGLLHKSQLPSRSVAVSVGDRLRVRILRVEAESGGREKIALTVKDVHQPSEAPASLLPPRSAGAQGSLAGTQRSRPPTAEELERLDCVVLSYARSSGAGGQAVNKLSTKCEARLNVRAAPWPAGVRERLGVRATSSGAIIVTAERQRTQAGNRKDALVKLATLVAEAWTPPKVTRVQRDVPPPAAPAAALAAVPAAVPAAPPTAHSHQPHFLRRRCEGSTRASLAWASASGVRTSGGRQPRSNRAQRAVCMIVSRLLPPGGSSRRKASRRKASRRGTSRDGTSRDGTSRGDGGAG